MGGVGETMGMILLGLSVGKAAVPGVAGAREGLSCGRAGRRGRGAQPLPSSGTNNFH